MESSARESAVDAGEQLIALLRRHVDAVAASTDEGDAAEALDEQVWDAVGAYGDSLDALYGDDDEQDDDAADDADELTFTVRTRYDYTVVDEKKFLAAGQGVGAAVIGLLEAGGKTIPALDVDSLETGSGLVTVHINGEPLTASDFSEADEPTDLLLIDPRETLASVLDEPVYASRAEAEAAAKNR